MKNFLAFAALAALTCVAQAADDSSKKSPPVKPCTIRSASTGAFFDLSSLHLVHPSKESKSSKFESEHSWSARGYDYGANFTLNICGPVVEQLDDVEGIKNSQTKNISAYYTKDKKTYSIGYVYVDCEYCDVC
jgi:cation-dependent mannose-6-phosphate receptor